MPKIIHKPLGHLLAATSRRTTSGELREVQLYFYDGGFEDAGHYTVLTRTLYGKITSRKFFRSSREAEALFARLSKPRLPKKRVARK